MENGSRKNDIVSSIATCFSSNVLNAILNTVSSGAHITNIASFVNQCYKDYKQKDEIHLDNMLEELCRSVAFTVLSEKIHEVNQIEWLKMQINKGALKTSLPGLTSTQLFSVPLMQQEEFLLAYYKKLFAIFREELGQVDVLEHDGALEELAKVALSRWKDERRKLRDNYSVFSDWLDEKTYSSLSEQMAGVIPPKLIGIADSHLLNRRVKANEEYWKQDILFVSSSDSSGSYMPARPKNEASLETWMSALAERLSKSPLFLVGPGGIGKSAFSSYLYDSIISSNGGPYERIILISLDTIIRFNNEVTTYDPPPADPKLSLFLRHIAAKSGDLGTSPGWKRIMQSGFGLAHGKRILMILDGFNEMNDSKRKKEAIYRQITSEITAFADKKTYPYLDLIVTSRIEETSNIEKALSNECKNQLVELVSENVKFQTAFLCGINEDCSFIDSTTNTESKALLQRPMYYKIFKGRELAEPLNQYTALKYMYGGLCEQSKNNTASFVDKKIRENIFEFFLPIIAYESLALDNSPECLFTTCFIKLKDPCTLTLINQKLNWMGSLHTSITADQISDYAFDFLTGQEQLIFIDKLTFTFTHQDYRDYLAAKYFLQRLDLLREYPASECWSGNEIDMNLKAYGKPRLKLIYQALDVSNHFKDYFKSKDEYTLRREDITPGRILWTSVACQIADLCNLAGITYSKADLQRDTIEIVSPLVKYFCSESKQAQSFIPKFNKWQLDHVTTILVKACECYRNEGDFDTANEIALAAYDNYNSLSHDEYAKSFNCRIIEHNIAKINLYSFAKHYQDRPEQEIHMYLKQGLDDLLKCATYSRSHRPYRFSCTLLAMLLTSPQPYLRTQDEYKRFILQNFHGEGNAYVRAFWSCYDGAFCAGDPDNEWSLLQYSLRQLLFVLSEKKVIVTASGDFTHINIARLHDESAIHVSATPENILPITSKDDSNINLILVAKILKVLPKYDEWWQLYFSGIVSFVLEEDIEKASSYFNAIVNPDIRTKLWIARINRDINLMQNLCMNGKKTAVERLGIDMYNEKEYYDRDVGRLCKALTEEVERDS